MSYVRPRRRLPMRPRRALAALAASAALVGGGTLIAGCGSSASLDPVARAAEVSAKQAGVRFTLEMQLSSPQLPSGFAIRGSGYANQAQKSGRLSIDLSGIPGLSSFAAGGARIEAVFLDPVVYMHMPFLAGKLPQGKTWMKLDVSKASKALGGGSMPSAFSLGQSDPTQFLQYLRASSGEVRKAGVQQLDGVQTTRYVATLQLSRVLEKLPAADRAAEQTLLQHVGVDGAIPVEVWVDTQHRVRRVQMSIDVSAATASGSATVTVNFTSYGAVPAISAPPAGEVADLTSMFSSRLARLHAG
jgi:hypothetical protein